MRIILSIVIVFYISTFLAQDKHDFSVEFNINRTNYSMEKVDEFMADTIWFHPSLFGKEPFDKINNGFDFGLVLNYQPLNFLDVGVLLAYQEKEVSRKFALSYTDSFDPNISFYYEGISYIKSNATTLGLSTNIYFNKLLHFESKDSKFLSRLQWAIGLQGGLAFSKLDYSAGYYPNSELTGTSYFQDNVFTTKNIHGKAEMKIGFKFVDKNIFSCIGLKVGYQLLNTHTLKDRLDVPLTYGENQTVKMNFSGLYYGVYLKIGK